MKFVITAINSLNDSRGYIVLNIVLTVLCQQICVASVEQLSEIERFFEFLLKHSENKTQKEQTF